MFGMHKHRRHYKFSDAPILQDDSGHGRGEGLGKGPCGRGLGPGHGKRDGDGHGPGDGHVGKGLGFGGGRGRGPGGGRGGKGLGFGRGGHRGRGGRGRNPLGRLIAHGNLHLLILHLIEAQPRHGYETIRMIEEMTGGTYIPSPGTIYPAFSMLEDQGFIAPAAAEGSKKRFAITDDGKAYLAENKAALESLLAHIAAAAKQQAATPSPRLSQAIDDLQAALAARLSRGTLSAEESETVAGALEAAARKIEGS